MPFVTVSGLHKSYDVAGNRLQVLRNRRDPDSAGLALGVLLAMFSIGLHSLTDFNLQIPANAATLVILMGLAAGQSPKPRRSPARTDRD